MKTHMYMSSYEITTELLAHDRQQALQKKMQGLYKMRVIWTYNREDIYQAHSCPQNKQAV